MKSRPILVVATCFFSLASIARADELPVQIEEVLVGANGDSSIQFIEIKMQSAAGSLWGPQGGETAGRIRLTFHDATGLQTNEYVFQSDPTVGVEDPVNGGYSVLIATTTFAALAGMPAPDFIIPKTLIAQDGKVCLTANPANPNAPQLNLCLSYGNFVADPGNDHLGQPAGAPAEAAPIVDGNALRRMANYATYGSGQYNADFDLAAPEPRNSAGNTGTITPWPVVDQGRNLFSKERFQGNGRTCSSCHQADSSFAVSPTKIHFLPPNDPLFVAEWNSVLEQLENPCLMRGARALILENIDGFANPPVFRGSPHLQNIAHTAPYGLSGEFATLQEFAAGAVQQHLPRTLSRNSDPTAGPLDFRAPTTAERDAMAAFMQSILLPADGDTNLDRMINAAVSRGADPAAIQRGRDLFFGVTGSAKCFKCHMGPVLARAHPSVGEGNLRFNTGVSSLPINASFQDACLDGNTLPPEAGGNREFSTPPLIGVSETAPYFHNNAVATLREAIHFYTEPFFNASPAAALPAVGTISMTEAEVDDIKVFLSALVEPFVDCDANMVDDRVELAGGAADCNLNGVLDSCEVAANDCNANGTPDACDLAPVKLDGPTTIMTVSGGFFVTSADIDGDNDNDLIVPGWTANNINIFLNNGTGQMFTRAGPYSVTSYPRGAAPADYDDDGDIDLAVPNLLADHVSLLLNNGTVAQVWLGFASQTQIPMGENGGTLFTLALDVDNDGDPDLVAVKHFMNQVAVVPNLGPDGVGGWLGFGTPVDYPLTGAIGSWSLAQGRLDSDAYADLVVVNQGSDNISVLMNDGAGGYLGPTNYATDDAPESVAVADLDSDGRDDVIVANGSTDTLAIRMNDGTGGLEAAVNLIVGSYPFGADPRGVSAADFDADGDLDLFAANRESSNVSVLLNDGLASFAPPLNTALGAGPDHGALVDLNNDGKQDIVVVQFAGATASVLLNQTSPFGGDCNRNGIPDSCDIAGGCSLDVNGNSIPDECEQVGDLNGDGVVNQLDLDLLAAVLVGNDTNPTHVARADINGDALRDGRDISPFVVIMLGE